MVCDAVCCPTVCCACNTSSRKAVLFKHSQGFKVRVTEGITHSFLTYFATVWKKCAAHEVLGAESQSEGGG